MYIVCPFCGASGRDGARFRFGSYPIEEETEPRVGDILKSQANYTCLTCTSKFPLWTYKVGSNRSFKANAVDENGAPWRPKEAVWNLGPKVGKGFEWA